MVETHTGKGENSEGHGKEFAGNHSKRSWLFRMSTISFVTAILAVVSFYGFIWFYSRMYPFWKCLVGFVILFFIVSVVTSLGSLVCFVIKRGKLLKEHILVFAGFMILIWVVLASAALPIQVERIRRVAIHSRLDKIYSAMRIYCQENEGRLPNAERWTDLLLEHDKRLSLDDFRYPSTKYGIFTFAFNKNIQGLQIDRLSPETVLVIECEGVRNLAGGSELCSEKFHKEEFFVLKTGGATDYAATTWAKELKWEP